MRTFSKFILISLLGLTISAPAYAYLDPNAGGLIFQLVTPIIALTTAALAFGRRQLGRAWNWISNGAKGLVSRLSRTSRHEVK